MRWWADSTRPPRCSKRAGACRAATGFGCDNCYGVCPDNAIIQLGDGTYEIDYDYCKGCGLCAAECPCGAIKVVPEQA